MRQRLRATILQLAGKMQKRVVGLLGFDLGFGQVGGGDIRSSMTIKAERMQMQKHGLFAVAGKINRFFGRLIGCVKI